MTVDTAVSLGVPIVAQTAKHFHWRNKNAYHAHCIDEEDLVGYLYERVLFSKYVPTVESCPDFYSEKSFQQSFYVACRSAMLDHVKRYISSAKRGASALPGAMVRLDAPDEVTGRKRELTSESTDHYLHRIKWLVDGCSDALTQRVLFLVALERYPSKHKLKKRLKLAPKLFESLWTNMSQEMLHFRPTS